MKLTSIILTAAALLILAGCQKDRNPAPSREGVEFSVAIGDYATRAADDHWDAGDNAGVYMIPAGGTLNAGAIAQNRKYTTTGDGTLAPASAAEEIYYPDNGSAVDFIAYYPWQTTITDFTYPVNVAIQAPMTAIDLLWSNNARGLSKGDPTAEMVFTHRLAKLVLNITLESGRIAAPGVTLEGMNTTAAFSLADGSLSGAGNPADVAMIMTVTGERAHRAEAIVIPGTGVDYTLLFTIAGKTIRLGIDDTDFEQGKKYVYRVNITDEALVEGDGEVIDWNEEPGGEVDIDVKQPQGEPTGLLYFDDEGALALGLWGKEITPENYRSRLAYFQFGSVVGFISDNRNGTGFDPARDIKFNPAGVEHANYLSIPRFTTDDYAEGLRNISAAEYHNAAAVLAGRGDPCRLIGWGGADFAGKNTAEVEAMLASADAGYRMPTGPENMAFVDGNADRWPEALEEGVPSVVQGEGNYEATGVAAASPDNPMTARFLEGGYPDVIVPGVGYRNINGSYTPQQTGPGFTWLWSSTPTSWDEYAAFNIGFISTRAWSGNYYDYEGGFIVRCVRL